MNRGRCDKSPATLHIPLSVRMRLLLLAVRQFTSLVDSGIKVTFSMTLIYLNVARVELFSLKINLIGHI